MQQQHEFFAENTYQIRVRGHLDQRWSDWFFGFKILHCGEDTILTGFIPDQAALHGVLAKIGELGLVIIYVKHLNHEGGNNEVT